MLVTVFSSLLIVYMRVAFMSLLKNKALRCLVVLNCLNASLSAKQHAQKLLVLQLVVRIACEVYHLIPNSFRFISILANSNIFVVFESRRKANKRMFTFCNIHILYGDFHRACIFLHVIDLLYF